jgi:polyphenol oxidase
MKLDRPALLRPSWPAPDNVHAFTTTREGGVSEGVYAMADGRTPGLNLGLRCGDVHERVLENRRRLRSWLPAEPLWLNQVHGTGVWVERVGQAADDAEPIADAAVTSRPRRVLGVLSADCLPVFFCDADGRAVGIAHAGWRGLAAGVLEQTIAQLRDLQPSASDWYAHLGPAIGPDAFEVGADVLAAFCDQDHDASAEFVSTGRAGKWWANLYGLARRRLKSAGIDRISGGEFCTVSDPARFYSHRRDRGSGRMASLIWLA